MGAARPFEFEIDSLYIVYIVNAILSGNNIVGFVNLFKLYHSLASKAH